MTNTVKNIFGVAAAVLVLLGFNFVTDSGTVMLPDKGEAVESAADKPVASLKDMNDAIVDIAESANPAVVTVKTEVVRERRVINPFQQFFGNPQDGGQTREEIRRGLGSGVIVSEDGYLLTNNHVIEGAQEINVRLYNGDEVEAELIGADPQTDIAVLKIDVDNAPALTFGNSDELKVGSFVLAIGSPLNENLAHTVSFGIVSAKGRNIGLLNQGAGYEDFIQTDAAINPGNSGGALVDMDGNLIGINSAIASRSGGNDGIGFSIPANLAKRIMDDLIEDGEVSRGYLGIYFAGEVDKTMAKGMGLDDARGIIIGRVEEDGPAEKAGLKAEDIIISVNGKEVRNWDSFRSMIAAAQPGEKIDLEVIRDFDKEQFTVILGERPPEETASVPQNENDRNLEEELGFSVTSITPEIAGQLGIENDSQGVVVNRVSESSNAYERGLKRGAVITEVKRKKVSNVAEFNERINELIEAGDEVVLLTIKAPNNLKQYIAFEL